MGELTLASSAFQNNGRIPSRFTCDGMAVNPPLRIDNVPANAKSLALIVEDPDAPGGTFDHWIVWNIDPTTVEIKENSVPKGAAEGINHYRQHNYGPPCPPSGTHRYIFRLYALDTLLTMGPQSEKSHLQKAMKGHIIAESVLTGLYSRK